MGWYSKVNMETGVAEENKVRAAATETKEFWDGIIDHPKFTKYVEEKYAMGSRLLQSIDADE
jgi:hypothetical protein